MSLFIHADIVEYGVTMEIRVFGTRGSVLENGNSESDGDIFAAFAGLARTGEGIISFEKLDGGIDGVLMDAFDDNPYFRWCLTPQNTKGFGGTETEIPARNSVWLSGILNKRFFRHGVEAFEEPSIGFLLDNAGKPQRSCPPSEPPSGRFPRSVYRERFIGFKVGAVRVVRTIVERLTAGGAEAFFLPPSRSQVIANHPQKILLAGCVHFGDGKHDRLL
jgi:hypothetical protein